MKKLILLLVTLLAFPATAQRVDTPTGQLPTTNVPYSSLFQATLGGIEWLTGVVVEPSIAGTGSLRANTLPWPTIHVKSYYANGKVGGGDFEYVSGTCSDNGGSIIKDTSNHCYYSTNKASDFHQWGIVADGTTDDTAAVQATLNQGNIALDLQNSTVAINGTVALSSTTNATISHAIFKATASISGNSAVMTCTSCTNFVADAVTWDANGNRRWGFTADIASTGALRQVDAKHYSDINNQGLFISSFMQVTLAACGPIQLPLYTTVTAGTSGSLASGTYAIQPGATDALGRQGPMESVGSGGSSHVVTGPTGSLAITFQTQICARSYRAYFANTADANGTWQRWYTIPDPVSFASTLSYTVTSGDVNAIAVPSAGIGTGTFTGHLPDEYTFRVIPYFSNGVGVATTTNSTYYPSLFLNLTSQVVNISWAAPSRGATPAGYYLCWAGSETGGVTLYKNCSDVGNVTSSTVTNSVGMLSSWNGNSDYVFANDALQSYTTYGKNSLSNDLQLNGGYGSNINLHFQLASQGSLTPCIGSVAGAGPVFRQIFSDNSYHVNWIGLAVFGDNPNIYLCDNTTGAVYLEADKGSGILFPQQSRASGFFQSNSTAKTGNSTAITIIPDTIDYNVNGNLNASTGIFTCPGNSSTYTALSHVKATFNIAFLPTAGVSEARVVIRDGSQQWITSTGAISPITQDTTITGSNTIACTPGDSLYLQFEVGGAGANIIPISGGTATARYSYITWELVP